MKVVTGQTVVGEERVYVRAFAAAFPTARASDLLAYGRGGVRDKKNVVLVAAGLSIAGHELRPLAGRGEAGAYPVNLEECDGESPAS